MKILFRTVRRRSPEGWRRDLFVSVHIAAIDQCSVSSAGGGSVSGIARTIRLSRYRRIYIDALRMVQSSTLWQYGKTGMNGSVNQQTALKVRLNRPGLRTKGTRYCCSPVEARFIIIPLGEKAVKHKRRLSAGNFRKSNARDPALFCPIRATRS